MADEIEEALKKLGIDKHIDFKSSSFKAMLDQAKKLAPIIQNKIAEKDTKDKAEKIATAMNGSEFKTAALNVQKNSTDARTKVAIAGNFATSTKNRSV